MLLIFLALAFVSGITISSLVPLPALIWAWWLVLPLGLLFIWRRDKLLTRAHLCLLFFLLGAMRLALARPSFDENSLVVWNDQGARAMIGDVIEPPEVRAYTTQGRVAVARVRVGNEWRNVHGLALVNAPCGGDVRYGVRIQIYGEPATPFESEDFSYKEYLARQNIHSVVRVYSGAKILERDLGNPLFATLQIARPRAQNHSGDFSGTCRVLARRHFARRRVRHSARFTRCVQRNEHRAHRRHTRTRDEFANGRTWRD